MAKPSVLIIGSGAGGSVAAYELAHAGFPVTVLEKGRNLFPGIGSSAGIGTQFGSDETKRQRSFENQDVILEPRTSRTQREATQGTARSFTGDVNTLPTTVGGGTVHWDAKVPRFWKQDFKGLSLFGPVKDANLADWPLSYDDLAPYYDEVEARIGVQGDLSQMPAATLAQAPRSKPFAMPPNPPMIAGARIAEGAKRLGYSPYAFPMAVNSQSYDGRPRCVSCGFCVGFGCPNHARGGAAVSWLHQAMQAGARLIPRAFASRIETTADGKRATGVTWIDESGATQFEAADIVIVAASAMETPRLLLMSASTAHPTGLANGSDQVGRNLMFHFFTLGVALFEDDVHSWRGPGTTFTLDDFVGPNLTLAAKATGLPFLKGGICEIGGSFPLMQEAQIFSSLPGAFGVAHKELMRTGLIRRHFAGISMVGEDLAQANNRVDLDPDVRDVYGAPVPRITYSPHRHEIEASTLIAPQLAAICAASPGVIAALPLPTGTLAAFTGQGGALAGLAATAHVMGTARMGDDPATSVVNAVGRSHQVDNLYVADGSVFVSSGGFNPTLTIMALSLRMARNIVNGTA
jgi:choline dehydrogenase-like flavoprotein